MNHYKIKQSITDRSSISVNLYLKDINKYPLLSEKKELDIINKSKNGDKQALDLLIKSNLRFVVSIAKQYQNKGIDFADLIEYGNLGLIKAAEKFDETRGFKFISYAVWWIRQSILQALAEEGKVIKLPYNKIIVINRINKYINTIIQQTGVQPTISDIANKFDIPEDKVTELLSNTISISSLDKPLEEDSDTLFSETIPANDSADSTFDNTALKYDVNKILSELSDVEEKVIKFYYGIGCTQKYIDDIAYELNLTKERVRQIKDKAIQKLRKSPNILLLTKYLG